MSSSMLDYLGNLYNLFYINPRPFGVTRRQAVGSTRGSLMQWKCAKKTRQFKTETGYVRSWLYEDEPQP